MSKGKLLIVEDEFVVAENLRTELESMGYAIAGMAFSGSEALELARRERPDLVLIDIKLLPGMDGIETAVRMRQEWDLPSIFLTSFSNESFLERAKRASPLGYLIKPFERTGLRATLEMALYRARMERLLKESESRFRSMFENSPVAYLALDEKGCCLDFNSGLPELSGYGYDELIGRNFFEFCSPGRCTIFREQLARLKDGGKIETELEIVCKDKTLRIVVLQGRLQSDMEGSPLRLHCILHNISERKRIEEERKQTAEAIWKQNAIQRSLLSAIPAYVYLKDKNSVYLAGNKKFSELSGIPEAEIPGKTDYAFFSQEDAECFRRHDAEIFATGEARLNYEMMGTDNQGNPIWYSTSKAPFYSSADEIAGLVGISIDITEQKRLEQERRQFEYRLQLAQKAKSLECMAGAVAHHFNNILGAVIGNLELAVDLLPEEANARSFITQALKATERASEMGRLMLTSVGQTASRLEFFDFAEVVEEAQSLLCSTLPENLRMKTTFPLKNLMIQADKAHLHQILKNLVSNAAEAIGEEHGCITVSVEAADTGIIGKTKIFPVDWQAKQKKYICLAVADTGPGLDTAAIEKIFDPFFTTKFTGRGMGLPVVLGLVQVYEGSVAVESFPGRGVTFRVYFPLAVHNENLFGEPYTVSAQT
jgi:PAS domain S-box-containing protein